MLKKGQELGEKDELWTPQYIPLNMFQYISSVLNQL